MRASDEVPSSKTAFVIRVDPRTHKLVRQAVAGESFKPAAAGQQKARISDLVEKSARAHNVDPLLVHSVIQVESNYNPYARSPKGAEGLMQLMPPTARMLGVDNSFDPQQNIEAGVKYLKSLQDLYKDDRLALAAYNAGPAAVEKYKWIPPFKETQNYVAQVGKRYGDARKAAAATETPVPAEAPLAAIAQVVVPTEDRHPKLEQFVDSNGSLHLRTAP